MPHNKIKESNKFDLKTSIKVSPTGFPILYVEKIVVSREI